jgi:hypothetical protein
MTTFKDLVKTNIENLESRIITLGKVYANEKDPIKRSQLSNEIQDLVNTMNKQTKVFLNR